MDDGWDDVFGSGFEHDDPGVVAACWDACDVDLFYSDEALAKADRALANVERGVREHVAWQAERSYRLAMMRVGIFVRFSPVLRTGQRRPLCVRPRERRGHRVVRSSAMSGDSGDSSPAGSSHAGVVA